MGIDPSLSSTGYAYRGSCGVVTGHIDSGKLRGPWRLHYVLTQMEKIVEEVKPDIVVYEDYAMGKTDGRIFHIGELGGVLKRMLWYRGIDIHLVGPTVLKKFVTGVGNPGFRPKKDTQLSPKQKKALIGAALNRDFGLNIHQNDEADAAGLLLFGEVSTGIRTIPNTGLKSLRADALKEFEVVRGKLQSISKR